MHRKIEFWILTSTEDIASMNIRGHLLKDYPFIHVQNDRDKWKQWEGHPTFLLDTPEFDHVNIRLALTNTAMIYLGDKVPKDTISDFIGADFCIFASRHKAKSAIPALLCHSTGNWSEDITFGGEPRSLCKTSARLVKLAYYNLHKHKHAKNLDWPVDLEVNHHGPTQFEFPLLFMELGSAEDNWSDLAGGKAVADAIMDTIADYLHEVPLNLSELSDNFTREQLYAHIRIHEKSAAIAFGGVHYARNFSKHLSQKAISFLTPKYFVPGLTEDLVKQMINNTLEPVNLAIIDWNSMNSFVRSDLTNLLDTMSISWIRRKEI